ncbi:SDR family oxidoreductase [Terrarubrum flagellatum]|uniref:SDR family NAD(P)-dependent oxidoreductase n=1 Tax=Terrirubrum flagellatum TaxID=2895980 RepID=UPI0031456FD0
MGALEGKAIVITGAGAGLGEAYARHAAGLGASVVVNDIDSEAASRVAASIEKASCRAVAKAGDISSWNVARELIECCVDSFGAIDGLVNNAGVLRPAEILDMSEADLRLMLDVNIGGSVACGVHAARRMKERGKGSIVNVTSGSHAGDVGLSGYGASKGAIASLTYGWALELRGSGVRVNAISPLAQTAMAQANVAFMTRQNENRAQPHVVMPHPDVSAPAVSYLLSDRSAAVNGQILRITGDALSLITHPMIAAPVLKGEWTFDAIRRAFDETLAARAQPLGLSFAPA